MTVQRFKTSKNFAVANTEIQGASLEPTLLLDFAGVKKLDPRITFTRNSIATYYDGVTTAKAEENLLLQSQTFDSASWTKNQTTVTENSTTAPDGTTTAETLTGDGASAVHNIQNAAGINFLASTYTLSVFAKANTNDFVQLRFFAGVGGAFANFNLATGAVGTSGAGATASIQSVGSGWYRCIVTATTISSAAGGFGFFLVTSDSAASAETNSLSTSVFLWGAQLEQRSAVTAYTPTTTQPITNYVPVLETAASGVARFDHNPLTGESLGLLVEEQRTNLVLQSEDLGTTWNLGSGTLTANAWVPPSGSLTGDIFTLPADSTVPAQNVTVANSTSYTLSFYFNKSLTTAAFFRLRFTVASGSVSAFIDVANLSFGAIQSGLASGEIINVGNGVYRAWVTMTYGASDAGARGIAIAGTTRNNSNTPDTGKNIAIWGIQYEQGAFPTSYIPTTSASVTRNSDDASMTGTNFSSWFNAAEGTLYAEATTRIPYTGTNLFPRLCEINAGGGTNNAIRMAYGILSTETDFRNAVVVNGVTQYASDSGESNGGRQILTYKTDDFSSASNGTLMSTDTSGTLPVVDALFLGSFIANSAGGNINGTIKKIAYYPLRLTNTELQTLTRE